MTAVTRINITVEHFDRDDAGVALDTTDTVALDTAELLPLPELQEKIQIAANMMKARYDKIEDGTD